MLTTFFIAWASAQISSLVLLWLGSRIASHRFLMRFGQVAHQRKMLALDRYWPLTQIRPAVKSGNQLKCSAILSLLILVKSLISCMFGVVILFWLPLASLIVPSIVTVHKPNDSELMSWIQWVATLQITSHVLAAALGFAIVTDAMRSDESVIDVLKDNNWFVITVLLLSLGFALAAGKAEASGIMKRGI